MYQLKYDWSTLRESEAEIKEAFPHCRIVSRGQEGTEIECLEPIEAIAVLEAVKVAHKKADKLSLTKFQLLLNDEVIYDY